MPVSPPKKPSKPARAQGHVVSRLGEIAGPLYQLSVVMDNRDKDSASNETWCSFPAVRPPLPLQDGQPVVLFNQAGGFGPQDPKEYQRMLVTIEGDRPPVLYAFRLAAEKRGRPQWHMSWLAPILPLPQRPAATAESARTAGPPPRTAAHS